VGSAVIEPEERAREQILYGRGDEDLTCAAERGHARRDVDAQSTELRTADLDLSRMDPGPDPEVQSRCRLDDGAGASDRRTRPIECREEPVAGGIDLPSLETLELGADEPVVLFEEVSPASVA
jgi:hypothetical protein